MNILLYRDDGLGDALFSIPTIKIILDNLQEKDKLFFASPYSIFIKNIIKDQKLIPLGVKLVDIDEVIKNEFELAIFLGPWGKIKNLDHLKIITKTQAKYKFIPSYQEKIVFKILKNFLRIFDKTESRIFFISFEKIFENHDIINTFNFINKAFEISNLVSLTKFKGKVFDFYNYEVFGNKAVHKREKRLVIHFTYKSLNFGFTVDDYRILINDLKKFWEGDLILVFGPFEKEYFNYIEGVNKTVISNLGDYMELCLSSAGMIGFDTGPVHLAAFLNTPFVISLFPDQGFDYRITRWKPFSNRSKTFVFKYSDFREIGKNILVFK